MVAVTPFVRLPEPLVRRFLELPDDRAFTSAEARQLGCRFKDLRSLVDAGLLAHPMRGVYVSVRLDDTLALRVEVLKLLVPEHCVVSDRTAGWLWGADMILAPNDHLETPRVSVFCPPGSRLRNGLTQSGERALAPGDVTELDGLLVTTPLRTACDLGRLLRRDQAFAALDSMAALNRFTLPQLEHAVARFKGYRGVVQLRTFAPLVDPRSQSPGESVLRLRWYDIGLPRPTCQVEVPRSESSSYWLDIGLPEVRFAAEYDGEEFHGEVDQDHDQERREWIRREERWTIVVARRANVFGQHQDVHSLLQRGYREALTRGNR